jgi:hypothetical protein
MKYCKYFFLLIVIFLSTAMALPVFASGNQAAASFVFVHNLSAGVVNPDVKELQKYLNAKGFVVAKSGAGSPGQETTKFGSATQAALIKFQLANKIKPAAGYFGPVTRAAVNVVPVAPIISSVSVEKATSTPAVINKIATTTAVVNNWQVIAANTCTSWTYTDWSPCSPWHNQTRSIAFSFPANCSGGNYVLAQSCDLFFDETTSTVAADAPEVIAATLAANNASTTADGLDSLLLSAAFFDNGKNVGLTCKPWVNKVLAAATNGKITLPFQLNDYSWALNLGGRIVQCNVPIEQADRADILQFIDGTNNLQHTAIVVTKTPTGMVWIHSNWDKRNTVSVDFITYAYFNFAVGGKYSIYHIY